MVGLIIGAILFMLTIFIALLPLIIKLLKWTGLWIVVIYLIIIFSFNGLIVKYSCDDPAWCYYGLYISFAISAILFLKSLVGTFRNIGLWSRFKIKGY